MLIGEERLPEFPALKLIDYDRLLGQNAIGERTLCVFLGPYAMVANAAE